MGRKQTGCDGGEGLLTDESAPEKVRPDVSTQRKRLGWIGDGIRTMLRHEAHRNVQFVVERSTSLGLPTWFLAVHALLAKAIAPASPFNCRAEQCPCPLRNQPIAFEQL